MDTIDIEMATLPGVNSETGNEQANGLTLAPRQQGLNTGSEASLPRVEKFQSPFVSEVCIPQKVVSRDIVLLSNRHSNIV